MCVCVCASDHDMPISCEVWKQSASPCHSHLTSNEPTSSTYTSEVTQLSTETQEEQFTEKVLHTLSNSHYVTHLQNNISVSSHVHVHVHINSYSN